MSVQVQAQQTRNVAEYNLSPEGTGVLHYVDGSSYDPVAYFPEGGGVAVKGKAEFSYDYEGVEYLFSSQKNLDTFKTDPAKYEPTYGGWCARAMVVGQKVRINAEIFTVNGRRLHFFVSKRAQRFFLRDLAKHEREADQNWKALSGEEPRL